MRPRWLAYVIAGALLAGIFFRFYHLDRKVYWYDEIYTSLRVLGCTESEWVGRAYGFKNAEDLRSLLHPGAAQSRDVLATVGGLALEDPQHGPLYFAAAHYWDRAFGDSTEALRGFSAVIGLLALAAAYWLCLELFEVAAAAWIGVALFALSPLLVLYSQEAREYSLWALVIFLMGASFLRAARLRGVAAWVLYAAVFVFGLYVYPPCAFLAAGQALYLVALERGRPAALVRPVAAMLVAVLCFSPWLFVMVHESAQIHRAWASVISTKQPVSYILRMFVGHFRRNFLDFDNLGSRRLNSAISLGVLVLVAYSLYFLVRNASARVWGYIVATMLVTALPIVAPDLLFAGQRTEKTRYFFPLFVDIDLALAYLFYATIAAPDQRRKGAPLWQAAFVAILAGRLASCAVSSQAETWWNKNDENAIAVARVINEADRPLLISNAEIGYALSLSNYLAAKVRVELWPRCYLCVATPGKIDADALVKTSSTDDVFLLGPSPELEQQVEAADGRRPSRYRCIDVLNCASDLTLW